MSKFRLDTLVGSWLSEENFCVVTRKFGKAYATFVTNSENKISLDEIEEVEVDELFEDALERHMSFCQKYDPLDRKYAFSNAYGVCFPENRMDLYDRELFRMALLSPFTK